MADGDWSEWKFEVGDRLQYSADHSIGDKLWGTVTRFGYVVPEGDRQMWVRWDDTNPWTSDDQEDYARPQWWREHAYQIYRPESATPDELGAELANLKALASEQH